MFFEKFNVIIFRQLCSNIKIKKYIGIGNIFFQKIKLFFGYILKKNLGLFINYLIYMKNCKGCFIINN